MSRIRRIVGEFLDLIRGAKRDYLFCFGSPAGRHVLADLAKFCRATQTCIVTPGGGDVRIPIDKDRTLVLEGRREVWLHIQQYLNLTSEELHHIYNPYQVSEEE